MAQPTVSFILATYNRGAVVVDCLRRVLGCGLPQAQFSIVVVDNASTDGTAELVAGLAREHQNLRLIRLAKNCGPVAKNVGIRGNSADFLVLLDDDAYPLPGAVGRMLAHFREDKQLGAAVFDVSLPDGRKEGSAYPDVFIGAGTGLRNGALRELRTDGGGRGGSLLPADFFMQAEEYDLSFRLLGAGYSIQRFWDMPLMHLKSPGARIGQRTTRLDVRNNLYFLAKYVPEPLCHQLAADWLSRYWLMALGRDREQAAGGGTGRHEVHGTHKQAFMKGAAQGLAEWRGQRQGGRLVLAGTTIERIFKFEAIRQRMRRVQQKLGLRRIAFGDLGKNMLPYYRAAEDLGLRVVAVVDEGLGDRGEGVGAPREYRGIPIVDQKVFVERHLERKRAGGAEGVGGAGVDAVVLTTISPVHAQGRAAALRRVLPVPVIDLFSRGERLLHGTPPELALLAP